MKVAMQSLFYFTDFCPKKLSRIRLFKPRNQKQLSSLLCTATLHSAVYFKQNSFPILVF